MRGAAARWGDGAYAQPAIRPTGHPAGERAVAIAADLGLMLSAPSFRAASATNAVTHVLMPSLAGIEHVAGRRFPRARRN